ncbi:hypothetical protein ACFOGI_05660 [Virgibacillus xinjiangensis]|uniref:F-box domain-containing protein n=1 Tax=Virgibacillus xinjiangensis TaxID=393090 RepID=A0ABV7CTK6_9BACI
MDKKCTQMYDNLETWNRELSKKEQEHAASEQRLWEVKWQLATAKKSPFVKWLKRKTGRNAVADSRYSLTDEKIADDLAAYRYHLYQLGFTERVIADLKRLVEEAEEERLKRGAAWELCRWFAGKKTETGARQALEYLPAAIQGMEDQLFLHQAAMLKADCLRVLGYQEEAENLMGKAAETGVNPSFISFLPKERGIGQTNREPSNRHFDVVIVSDFRLSADKLQEILENIHVNHEQGLTTGLLQKDIYDFRLPREMNPALQEKLKEGSVHLAKHNEHISCELLLIRHPKVLEEKQVSMPEIRPRMVRVIMDELPEDRDLRYSLRRCSRNLQTFADKQARWHPVDEKMKSILTTGEYRELKYIKLASDPWKAKDGMSSYPAFLEHWLVKTIEGS